MVWETALNAGQGVVILLLLMVCSFFIFKHSHRFYEKLKIYHKTPAEYDPIIEVRGDPPPDFTVGEYALEDELWADDGSIVYETEWEGDELDPQIVVDCDTEKVLKYGEDPFKKFFSLAFWTGSASLVPLIFVFFYFTVYGGPFNVANESGISAIATLLLISSFHLTIRIASLADIDEVPYDDQASIAAFRSDLHDFAYSFFLSLYLLGVFGVVISTFRTGIGTILGDFTGDGNVLLLFGFLAVVLPFVIAGASQKFLRSNGVYDEIALDKPHVIDVDMWSDVEESGGGE